VKNRCENNGTPYQMAMAAIEEKNDSCNVDVCDGSER